MKKETSLIAVWFLLHLSCPVSTLYTHPLIGLENEGDDYISRQSLKPIYSTLEVSPVSITAASDPTRSTFHVDGSYNGLPTSVAEVRKASRPDQEERLSKRESKAKSVYAKLNKFKGISSKGAIQFAKHHPKRTALIFSAMAVSGAYALFDKALYSTKDGEKNLEERSLMRSIHSKTKLHGHGDHDEDDWDQEGNLAKRAGPVDKFMGKATKGTVRFAKKNPYTAVGLTGATIAWSALKVWKYTHDRGGHRRREEKGPMKRGLGSRTKDDLELERRGTTKKWETKGRALMKTKKGRLIVGGMVVKTMATAGFLYYLHHKKSKQQPTLGQGYRLVPDERFSRPDLVSSSDNESNQVKQDTDTTTKVTPSTDPDSLQP